MYGPRYQRKVSSSHFCGAGGIGFAIVKDLLSNGANVAFTSRSRERLDVAMHKLEEQGLSALARPSSTGCQDDLLEQLKNSQILPESIDILVNNVGDTLEIKNPYCELGDWHRLFDLVMGVAIRLNNYFIPSMSQKKWGRIVNITAGAAYENSGQCPTARLKLHLPHIHALWLGYLP